MPLLIRNKEMARKDALQKSLARQTDGGATFGEFVDNKTYTYGKLPLFIKERRWETDNPDKPIFHSRVASGNDFNPKRGLAQSPCQLNLIDILDVKRTWTVLEDQGAKHRTMAKKFNVTAADVQMPHPDSAQVPLKFLPESVMERCKEAAHSHYPGLHFPMGTDQKGRQNIMNIHSADAEVEQLMSGSERGNGDARNMANMNTIPNRVLKKRTNSPAGLARSASVPVESMMSSGTMLANRTFSSPGIPDAGESESGFLHQPMGLPHITFAAKPKRPKMKPWMTRRGSLTTVKSPGWKERDLTKTAHLTH